MIVRILGEGQFEIVAGLVDELNVHDGALESALHSGSDADFHTSLRSLLGVVRAQGVRVPEDFLGPSDITLPAEESTPDEVRAMLAEDGLIPG